MTGVSKSLARRCVGIDDKIAAFSTGLWKGWLSLAGRDYVKTRENGRVVSVAVIVAVAVNSDGRREILGMAIGAPRPRPSGPNSAQAGDAVRGVKLVIWMP